MSAELKLPLDFERLPEYRLFGAALYAVALSALPVGGSPSPRPSPQGEGVERNHLTPALSPSGEGVDGLALGAFLKLWVNLGYEASRTNEPGLLTADGVQLWASEIRGLSPIPPVDVLEALVGARVLVRREDSYFCERFARLNAHLSGKHEKREDVGARHSAITRSRRPIAAEASAQAMLLPPEIYKDRTGQPLNGTQVQQVLVHVRTLDRCLGLKDRLKSQYSEGLIADAAAALADVPADSRLRDEFYFWFNDHREHPALPKTTEQMLASWVDVMAMMKSTRE